MNISQTGKMIAMLTPMLAEHVRTRHRCLRHTKFTDQMSSDLYELCELLLEECAAWHRNHLKDLDNTEAISFMTGKVISIREYLMSQPCPIVLDLERHKRGPLEPSMIGVSTEEAMK